MIVFLLWLWVHFCLLFFTGFPCFHCSPLVVKKHPVSEARALYVQNSILHTRWMYLIFSKKLPWWPVSIECKLIPMHASQWYSKYSGHIKRCPQQVVHRPDGRISNSFINPNPLGCVQNRIQNWRIWDC